MSWLSAPHPFDLTTEDLQQDATTRRRLLHSAAVWIPHPRGFTVPTDDAADLPERTKLRQLLHTAPSWIPRRRSFAFPDEEIAERPQRRVLVGDLPGRFRSAARGLYRIFNTAGYRFYWSNAAPPVAGSTPQAIGSTLAYNTTATFADGTWHFSVSYFDGVLDSGFLPLGPHGENYLSLTISGGAVVPVAPTPPFSPALRTLAGGVVQIVGYYNRLPDGTNAADTWAVAYTTNGAAPANALPNLTQSMNGTSIELLKLNLPTQANGALVKVQLQVRRSLSGGGFSYSAAGPVLSAVASTAGPSAPLSGGG